MKSRTGAVIAALFVFIIAFLFLVPVVSYSMPAGVHSVPPSYVRYGSITYWALGAGGTWRYIGHGAEGYTQGYSVSMVAATASASSTSTVSYASTATTTCSPATNQENPLLTFRVNIKYNGPWNATAAGYSNSTTNQTFLKCYLGNGNGWILIADWNPSGSAVLNLTVQKMDSSGGNLTAIGGSQQKSTIAPYGAVTISLTAVP